MHTSYTIIIFALIRIVKNYTMLTIVYKKPKSALFVGRGCFSSDFSLLLLQLIFYNLFFVAITKDFFFLSFFQIVKRRDWQDFPPPPHQRWGGFKLKNKLVQGF